MDKSPEQRHPQRGTRIRLPHLLALMTALLGVAPVEAGIPEPDSIFYGTVTVNNAAPPLGTQVIARTVASQTQLAVFTVQPAAAPYVLRIPLETADLPRTLGKGLIGEQVQFLVNGSLVTGTQTTARGTVVELALNGSIASTPTATATPNGTSTRTPTPVPTPTSVTPTPLTTAIPPPGCGNGVVDGTEQCERGVQDCGAAQTCYQCQCVPECAIASLDCPDRASGAVSIPLQIDVDTKPLATYGANVTWDPDQLSLSVSGGSTFEFAGAPICNIPKDGNQQQLGNANCTAFQTSQNQNSPTGVVSVASLNFETTCSLFENVTVGVTVSNLTTTTGQAIPICGPVDVCTMACGTCGDVNCNGRVEIGDAMTAAQYSVSLKPCGAPGFQCSEGCDVNNDSACSIGDALLMAQCEVGLVSCNFQCTPFVCPPTQQLSLPREAAKALATPLPVRVRTLVNQQAVPGGTLTVEVIADMGTLPLGAYALDVECDPNYFEMLPPVAGGASAPFASPPLQTIEGCVAHLAAFQVASLSGPTGEVSVATLQLRVKDDAPVCTSTALTLNSRTLFATTGTPVTVSSDPSAIRIGPIGNICNEGLAFECSAVKVAAGSPVFSRALGLDLAHALGTSRADAQRPTSLCSPVSLIAGEAPKADALMAYQLKPSHGCSTDGSLCASKDDCPPGASCKRGRVLPPNGALAMTSRLGDLVVDTRLNMSLLIPTALGIGQPPLPLSPPSATDPFVCYEVKEDSKVCLGDPTVNCGSDAECGQNGPCFLGAPKSRYVTIHEPSGAFHVLEIRKPTKICAASNVATLRAQITDGRLVCWAAKMARKRCSAAAPSNAGSGCSRETNCGGLRGKTSFCEPQVVTPPAGTLHVNDPLGQLAFNPTRLHELCTIAGDFQ